MRIGERQGKAGEKTKERISEKGCFLCGFGSSPSRKRAEVRTHGTEQGAASMGWKIADRDGDDDALNSVGMWNVLQSLFFSSESRPSFLGVTAAAS